MISCQLSCYSEHDELEAVMVCAPSMRDVPDKQSADNVKWSYPYDHKKAEENFYELKRTMEKEDIKVIDYSEELPEAEKTLSHQLINRLFVRDLACVFGEGLIPGIPAISMRKPEYYHSHLLLKKWFPEAFLIHESDLVRSLEFGDVLILNKDAIWINVGMRTSLESVYLIKDSLFHSGFSEIGVIDLPRKTDTLHLDMNCNVASHNLVVSKSYVNYFPMTILTQSGESRYEMPETFLKRHGFDVYWLEKYDTIPDINFLNLNPETLLVSKKAHKQRLQNHHRMKRKQFIEVDVTELEKGGGGIRCMTLPLKRK